MPKDVPENVFLDLSNVKTPSDIAHEAIKDPAWFDKDIARKELLSTIMQLRGLSEEEAKQTEVFKDFEERFDLTSDPRNESEEVY